MPYPLRLALLGLRRSPWLTLLVVLAIAVGIGSSVTVYTMLHTMGGDPIPAKSARLFVPLIDSVGRNRRFQDELPTIFNWPDAQAFRRFEGATHQAAMYEVGIALLRPDAQAAPTMTNGRATHGDFFAMFDLQFREGRGWTPEEAAARANVLVLTESVADQLFPDHDAVGKTLRVERRDYVVIGITRTWKPQPRFYDVGLRNGVLAYSRNAETFIPIETALDAELLTDGALTCTGAGAGASFSTFANSDCLWLQYWVELPDAAAARRYEAQLRAYAVEQQRVGRYGDPDTRLVDLRGWLELNRIVPDELRIATVAAFGFLAVCLVNAVALMLARGGRTAAEFGLRRAVGASRRALFLQGLWEAGLLGVLGGLIGLGLAFGGLRSMRVLLPTDFAVLTRPVPGVLLGAMLLSAVATVCAGLYPAWRASRVGGFTLKAS